MARWIVAVVRLSYRLSGAASWNCRVVFGLMTVVPAVCPGTALVALSAEGLPVECCSSLPGSCVHLDQSSPVPQ